MACIYTKRCNAQSFTLQDGGLADDAQTSPFMPSPSLKLPLASAALPSQNIGVTMQNLNRQVRERKWNVGCCLVMFLFCHSKESCSPLLCRCRVACLAVVEQHKPGPCSSLLLSQQCHLSTPPSLVYVLKCLSFSPLRWDTCSVTGIFFYRGWLNVLHKTAELINVASSFGHLRRIGGIQNGILII